MNNSEMSLENLKRIPGLRWELNEVLEPQGRYRIEDAGTHADGTPLLAVYTSDRVGETNASTMSPMTRPPVTIRAPSSLTDCFRNGWCRGFL